MKFTIEREVLILLLEKARGGYRTKRNRNFGISLSACDARVFITGPTTTAGYEALVFEDGECYIKAKTLLQVLRTYPGKTNVTIEVNDHGLHIEKFTMPVNYYTPRALAPAKFQVFPVTDLKVLGTNSIDCIIPGDLPEG